MKSQSDTSRVIDGIYLTPEFNFKDLLASAAMRTIKLCDCCALADVYNGIGSGPLLFICPKGCSCHD